MKNYIIKIYAVIISVIIVTACGKICGVRIPGKKFEELSRFERYLVKYIEEKIEF